MRDVPEAGLAMTGDYPLIFAVWHKLSETCQQDLVEARPGSIIRCSETDFDNLRYLPLDDAGLLMLKQFQAVGRKERDEVMTHEP